MRLSNGGTAAARFGLPDFAEMPEDLRAESRERCRDFIGQRGLRE